MASSPTKHDGKFEDQPSALYPSSCDYENDASVAPMPQYGDPFNDMYISTLLPNDGTYNTPLHSNVWTAEPAAAAPGIHVADPMTSPSALTHYMPIPLPSPFIGASTMTPNELQMQIDFLAYTSPVTPWWPASQSDPGSRSNPTTPATSLEAAMSNFQWPKMAGAFLENVPTDLSQVGNFPGFVPGSLQRRTSMPCAAGSSEAWTGFESSASRPATSAGNFKHSQNPTRLVSKVVTPKSGAGNSTSPRRPASSRRVSSSDNTRSSSESLSRRASSGNHTHANSQSLSPIIRHEKRSRFAAQKCRAKSKAAEAALEASERSESQRHNQLLAIFRTLQSEVFTLKNEILQHADCGDALIGDYLASTARFLVTGSGSAAEGAPGDGWSMPDWTNMQPLP